ncbi:MAG TPA: heavy-metal-associated domain-containing protein [Bacteroidota bacterium]|nr:heavy-metal-associated domain-containing protein [Bacteroidota bacterium]
MTERTYTINGMTCNHCVMSLRKELAQVEGLEVLNVGIGSATVAMDEVRVSDEQLRAAVERAGFSVAAS